MYAGCAVRANAAPVMPGAAARAPAVSSRAAAAATKGSNRFIEVAFIVVIALIAVPLVDVDFGHQAAEVLRVVRQVVQIGRVQVIRARRDARASRAGGRRIARDCTSGARI